MNWQHLIALQISGNGQINLLSGIDQTGFAFSDRARALIDAIFTGRLSGDEEQKLLHFTVAAVLSSFYQVNQYFQFDKQAESELLLVYQQLLHDIKGSKEIAIDYNGLAETHYLRLQKWLLQKQPEAVLLYPASQPKIENPVVLQNTGLPRNCKP